MRQLPRKPAVIPDSVRDRDGRAGTATAGGLVSAVTARSEAHRPDCASKIARSAASTLPSWSRSASGLPARPADHRAHGGKDGRPVGAVTLRRDRSPPCNREPDRHRLRHLGQRVHRAIEGHERVPDDVPVQGPKKLLKTYAVLGMVTVMHRGIAERRGSNRLPVFASPTATRLRALVEERIVVVVVLEVLSGRPPTRCRRTRSRSKPHLEPLSATRGLVPLDRVVVGVDEWELLAAVVPEDIVLDGHGRAGR